MYLIGGNITSNVTGNLLVITGNGNIGNITSNFRTLVISDENIFSSSRCTILQAEPILLFPFISLHSKSSLAVAEISNHCLFVMLANLLAESF